MNISHIFKRLLFMWPIRLALPQQQICSEVKSAGVHWEHVVITINTHTNTIFMFIVKFANIKPLTKDIMIELERGDGILSYTPYPS